MLHRYLDHFTLCGFVAAIAIAGHVVSAGELDVRDESPAKEPTAIGRVTLYGVETTAFFALSEMPEGIERFSLVANNVRAMRELILMAADRKWVVHVNYVEPDDDRTTTVAYKVWVDEFQNRK